jgi:hypothetical protein
MRRVKSQADLKRLALAAGAQVELGASKFNTTMDKVSRREPEPAPAPAEPAPEQPTPQAAEPAPADPPPVVATQETIQIHLDMDPVAQAIESGNEKVVQAIAERLRELRISAPAASPKSWTFTIKRDVRGFIESVDAAPRL